MANNNCEKDIVQVAKKVLLCALEQLDRAQALVSQAQENYWKAVEKHSAYAPINSESESAPTNSVSANHLESTTIVKSTEVILQAHSTSADGEKDESQESNSLPSQPSPRAQVITLDAAEGDNAVSPVCPPSPRARTALEAEWDAPPCTPSPRAHTALAAKPQEWEDAQSQAGDAFSRTSKSLVETSEGDKHERVPRPPKRSVGVSTKTFVDGDVELDHSSPRITVLEEPERKKLRIENRFVLVEKQQQLVITADILLGWIYWLWTNPARIGIENKQQTTDFPNTPPTKPRSKRQKVKKTSKNKDSEEEKTKRRERDRLRKREQRRKLKEEAQKSRARVPLSRIDAIPTRITSIPQPPLFTSCTGCKEDCWYKGTEYHELNWQLCVVCHINWANGDCVHRIPYECRICRLKRST